MKKNFEQLNSPEFGEADEAIEKEKVAYREIIGLPEGEDPDLILVLDAGIAERKVFGESRYVPTSYEDETGNFSEQAVADKSKYNLRKTDQGNFLVGAGGGKARVLAVRNLSEVFTNVGIITDSRYPVGESDQPDFPEVHSQIYKRYLERAGIPSDRIEEENESTTTFEGLINFLLIAVNEKRNHLVVVTNDYHLPRTEKIMDLLMDKEKAQKLRYIFARMPEEYRRKIGAKIEHHDDGGVDLSFDDEAFFEKLKGVSVIVVSAEDILAYDNPHYKNLFDKVRNTVAYKKRVNAEQKGIRQLEDGVYGKIRKE